MGGAAPLCRALVCVSVLVINTGGLRLIRHGEDCSQPDIQCTIKSSSCFDFSWLQSFQWTPNAPSHMEVTVGIGQNEVGRRVPLLQINWTISIDASIKELQGIEISVLEVATNLERCIQFQFNNSFSRQVNENGQPWQFYSNNFEVNPGQEYDVTVQHLPKQEGVNYKRKQITAPWCNDGDMMQTHTCCDLGFCWYPDITITHEGENLTVEFRSRWDATEYGVEVKVRDMRNKSFQKVSTQQGPRIQRVQATFPHIGGFIDMECVYNITVWPYMPPCGNDCLRLYYVPPCATETPPPPEPVKRWYLWPVTALLTITWFGWIIFALRPKGQHKCDFAEHLKCIESRNFFRVLSKSKDITSTPCSDEKTGHCHQRDAMFPVGDNKEKIMGKPPPPPIPPVPISRKVWLVYSADNKHYTNVVIRLTDFMRLAWGLDVVLDRLHVQEMGTIGPMAWLGRQKDEIEKAEGTILILCSRGVQEKWKAMQNVKEQKMTLREDRKHLIEDLCTPALSLILPDFQHAKPYDRYVVAYFSSISTLADIPSLLEICPKYSLTENLQNLFFRIQRQEQHQPRLQLTVSYDEHPSYRRLVKTIERCREWQEHNPGWFEKECLVLPVEDLEDTEEEEDVDDNATRKVYPVPCYPETSVSVVHPFIMEPDLAKVLDPTIVIGTPSTQVEPFLSDVDPSVSIVQPLHQEVTAEVVCIQEPWVVGEDPSLEELHRYPLRQEVSVQSDQGALSIEQLREAQKRLFQNSMEIPDLSSAMEFMDALGQDLLVPIMGQPVGAGEPLHEIFLDEQLMPSAVHPGTGLLDRHSIQLTDQGYSSWNPHEMDLKAIQMESLKFLLQNEGHLLNIEQV